MGSPNEANPIYDYLKERYESYVHERDRLNDSSLAVSERYDKAVLFLAGGSLALSVTFIEKVAPNPQPWTFVLLIAAWLLLIASILLELHALANSQTAINQQILLLDNEYDAFLVATSNAQEAAATGSSAAQPENEFSHLTRRLNVWSLRCLGVGIALLCLFSAVNLPYGKRIHDMSDVKKSKGSYVPPGNVRPPPAPPPGPVKPSQPAPPPR